MRAAAPNAPEVVVAQPVASLRTLLRGVVDFAGLFPPASQTMAAAVAEYAEHRAGVHAWALGRFIVPAARLEEFESASANSLPREGARSWALSALLGSDLEADVSRIEQFNARHRDARAGAVYVDTVELKAHTVRDVARAAEVLDRQFDTYMEIPIGDEPENLVTAISHTKAKAKVRTGGVTGDAFPPAAHVTRFLAACVRHNVAFKATAGLHHPWRNEYPLTYAADAPTGAMFGFLNVLLAVAALRADIPNARVIALLEERDANAVSFDAAAVRWRECTFTHEHLESARESMCAIGSCSFRDPIDGLRASALL